MNKRVKLEIPVNEIYNVEKTKDIRVVKKEDGKTVDFADKLSPTYPRITMTLIGRINCVENGLLYIASNRMKVSDMRKPYKELIRTNKNKTKSVHRVKYYHFIELMLIADSVLRDKELVIEILKNEELKDLHNVDFVPVKIVKSGLIKTTELYPKKKSYMKNLKRVVWEIKKAFDKLEQAYKDDGDLEEDEKMSPETIRNFSTEEYKIFKNEVKDKIADFILENVEPEENVLENVRGADTLLAKDLKDIWLR